MVFSFNESMKAVPVTLMDKIFNSQSFTLCTIPSSGAVDTGY